MIFVTQVSGYSLVNLDEYNNALHRLREVAQLANNIRVCMLRDIKLLEDRDKNTFAKSIRLITKFHNNIDTLQKVSL